ncbi:MAG: bifunctional diaminohydroxyphosphoribosylaminopyrimidine deaminase/5-amino-6-(5-phosphoribosylamino)uracil reductase RibD [Acetobacteraceae bacterium]|nr:bifunctional diaminohydroxyphosphoribosylaminopyrimidine deaminase/5-amino-6-(5-phosphoribosylamino)uracil reductase RibD [Acetobacteraceae bacterium]
MGAPDPADVAHMRAALALARRGLGVTWPNPSVGCVIVRDGRVVGRASTAPGGRPHAETAALAHAGGSARGATAYVTLEPCCHWGRTPPCTGALVDAGVARVVLGVRDPDSRVDGQGIAALRARGIEVVEGVLEDEAAEVIAAFGQRVRAGRPLVTLKLASTLDGRIATRAGESRWITGPAARRAAHALRGCHDAVMVGIGTALADDPDLTCRIPGMRALPVVRVVADSTLRTPFSSRLVASASEAPVWLLVSPDADPAKRAEAERLGARVIAVHPHPNPLPQAGEGALNARAKPTTPPLPRGEGRGEGGHTLNLHAALLALGAAGLTSVLAEGGARLAAGLLQADLVDRLAWFHAPAVIGGDGLPAASAMGLERLADLPRFRRHSATPLGGDMLTTFERAP